MATSPSGHVSVRIERPFDLVYAYVSSPEEMNAWAAGLGSALRGEADDWVADGAISTR